MDCASGLENLQSYIDAVGAQLVNECLSLYTPRDTFDRYLEEILTQIQEMADFFRVPISPGQIEHLRRGFKRIYEAEQADILAEVYSTAEHAVP